MESTIMRPMFLSSSSFSRSLSIRSWSQNVLGSVRMRFSRSFLPPGCIWMKRSIEKPPSASM